MLTRILHQLVALPWVYDCVQILAGVPKIYGRLAPRLGSLSPTSVIVDMGGGTGAFRHLCPPACRYLCLDMDRSKLRGHRRKHRRGVVILSDATRPPVKDRSADVVLCTFLAHHLSDQALARVLSESRRILKETGFLLFMDPIWQPSRWIARLLWKYDRGANPRTGENLRSAVSDQFRIVDSQRFAVHHEYVLFVGTKHLDNDPSTSEPIHPPSSVVRSPPRC